jgi:hypothetical protein
MWMQAWFPAELALAELAANVLLLLLGVCSMWAIQIM